MFTKFDEHSRKVLLMAKLETEKLKHSYIGTEHVFLAILSNNKYNVTKVFNTYNIYYKNYKSKLIEILGIGNHENESCVFTPLLKHVLEESEVIAKDQNRDEISLLDIVNALFYENDGVFIRILISMGIDIESLSKEFLIKKSKKNSKKKYMIEEIGYSMNKLAERGILDPVVGREKEIERIIEILCRRNKNNPLLIGSAGVGKTAIVEELSRRIVEETVPYFLKFKKIISISMATLVSGTKYRGEFEERITKMLNEIENNDDIILFIDEIHTLVGAGGAEGAIDASNILKPFLARGKIRIIGATTIEEYKKYMENDKALDRRFQTVLINEPKLEEVITILKKIKPAYEKFHNVKISNSIIEKIAELSDKYIYDRNQPDKAIDILDEVCSKTSLKKDKKIIEMDNLKVELSSIIKRKNNYLINQDFNNASKMRKKELLISGELQKLCFKNKVKNHHNQVSLKTVADVLKSKTQVPIYELVKEDLNTLKKMNYTLSQKIMGQENVIIEICNDIKKIKLGYKLDNKPRSYLFVGPSGVGKTCLAKEISNIISNDNSLIRLDMSEFKESNSVTKIIGSPPGYIGFSNKNTILDEIKIKPNAVILLDEIEKAHKDVINLFLQVLDEGKIKTSNNETIRFDNNIIIMTSNLGCKKADIGFLNNNKLNIISTLKDYLGTEFVNRIDKVFIFNSLNEETIKRIIQFKTKNILKKLKLKPNCFKLSKSQISSIIMESKYSEFGARKLDKIINNIVTDKLIEEKFNNREKLTIETV